MREDDRVTSIIDTINRVYARPPLSWLVTAFQWLADLFEVPLRPLERLGAERRARLLAERAAMLAAIGLEREATECAALSTAWSNIAARYGR